MFKCSCFIRINHNNLTGLFCEFIHNFNVGAGHPDLGSSCGIPPPAEHVIAWLEVLRHDNVVLVEALLELVIIDRPLVPPGAALRGGADTHVRLLLRLPGSPPWIMGSSRLPGCLRVPPVGHVIGELKNVLPKALLSEAFLAGGGHLTEPVVVSAPMVDRHKAHRHNAAASPLGRLCLGEVYVDGPAAIGPGSAIPIWRWQAHGACWAVVRDVSVVRTAKGVATMDAAPFPKFSCIARKCPWVFFFCAPPRGSSYMSLTCWWMLGAVVKVVVGSVMVGLPSMRLFQTSSRGRAYPSCQIGGHTMPPCPRTLDTPARTKIGNISVATISVETR